MPAYRGKRLLDMTLVVFTAPLWAPTLFVIALVVLLVLGRPILFVQERAGLHARPFPLLKFRTMTTQCEEGGALLPDEQRLTKFGRFLRSTSLDELPELINVLRGHMSLVGPRPLLMEYVPLYSSLQSRRHETRPGLTGWAQVNGRNLTSWKTRLDQDVWYVQQASLALDLRILARTLAHVLRRHGISEPGQATMTRFTGEQHDD